LDEFIAKLPTFFAADGVQKFTATFNFFGINDLVVLFASVSLGNPANKPIPGTPRNMRGSHRPVI
jgi:hypothetical protein